MGRYDPFKLGEVRDTNHREMNLLMMFYAFDAQIKEHGHVLNNRFKAVPRGAINWGLYKHLTRKLLTQICDTLPDIRCRQLMSLRNHGRIIVQQDHNVKYDPDVLVPGDDFNVIASAAINGDYDCVTCMREGKEIKACPLRKALINCVPPKVETNFTCEYYEIARAELDRIEKEGGA